MTGNETGDRREIARQELANRLFFRLYQCANMMHKTGTRALDAHGVTTQQWAALGALSRPEAEDGMSIGDLTRYLKVSRQNLAGVVARLEKTGYLGKTRDKLDKRSRRIVLTSKGRRLWESKITPLIFDYYDEALDGVSTDDLAHIYHYLDRMLDNFSKIDNS